MADPLVPPLKTLIVDDEPLAIDRLRVISERIAGVEVIAAARDGTEALELIEALGPDLVLLDLTMPEMDGLAVARQLAARNRPPAVIFVTAHDDRAVDAFDLDAVDYVLKPVEPQRLERAIARVAARRAQSGGTSPAPSPWLEELWVPHRSELVRIGVSEVARVDAERDYVRLHVGGEGQGGEGRRSYLLLQTIAGLEARLDPERFIRIHRSIILRRDRIKGLRHDGLGVWSVETADGAILRIGRTYLAKVKAMAGR
ncbi:LytR/AlgR family response regulator transcription factor [Qipengyuania sediminis]|uniref:LytR/AlgR family response regulator transcription factor n=1 Tax=Qipengyuania sediminis TaxID=1532023 RepID=UPI001059E11F|nr:LytTR family DNA-binding domain-containing protein [Qipengyuania sediminis]